MSRWVMLHLSGQSLIGSLAVASRRNKKVDIELSRDELKLLPTFSNRQSM
jgi:hypothetical protein